MNNAYIAEPSPHHWKYRKIESQDYENMRNNGMTAGLDGFAKVTGEPLQINKKQIIATYENIKHIVPGWFWDMCYQPGIGNPVSYEYDGKNLVLTDLHCLINAWRLYDYGIEHKTIVDIGGGFGCLAGQLMTLWDSDFYMVDLEDSLNLQDYYLSTLHPDRSVTYLTPDQPIPECDLVINTRSFMEMTAEQIYYYFNQINHKAKYLYTANRYLKYDAILKNYPFGDDWQILISAPLPTQAYIHEFYLKKGEGRFSRMLSAMPPWE